MVHEHPPPPPSPAPSLKSLLTVENLYVTPSTFYTNKTLLFNHNTDDVIKDDLFEILQKTNKHTKVFNVLYDMLK